MAEDAAAKAADTASADEAKRKVYEDAARGSAAPNAEMKTPGGSAETEQKPASAPMAADENKPSSEEPRAATEPTNPSPS